MRDARPTILVSDDRNLPNRQDGRAEGTDELELRGQRHLFIWLQDPELLAVSHLLLFLSRFTEARKSSLSFSS